MTAEELVELLREAKKWDFDKTNRIFEGEGYLGYLEKYGVKSFVSKMKLGKGLTIDDLEVGDVITNGDLKYAVLAVNERMGAYVLTSEKETRYVVGYDIANFWQTGLTVAHHLGKIMDMLEV